MGNCSSCCRQAEEPPLRGQIEVIQKHMPEELIEKVKNIVKDKIQKRYEMVDTWANRDGNDHVSLARDIKLELDETLGPAWMVIAGDDFGYDGEHMEGHFARFIYDADKEIVIAKVI